jgi:hypothetical protein
MVHREFDSKDEHQLSGIIRHLTDTKARGSNVHKANVVTITTHDILENRPDFAPANVVDLESTAFYKSKDKKDQWIMWDFHDYRLRPSKYAIQSGNCGIYLKSWVLEGSVDGSTWVKLNERKGYNNLKAANIVQTFDIAADSRQECRYLRLSLLERNHSQTEEIVIRAFEVYGTLTE